MAYTISGSSTINNGSLALSNGVNTTVLALQSGTTPYTLTLPSQPGGIGTMLQSTGTTLSRFRSSVPLMWIVRDIKPPVTQGATLTPISWHTRELNTLTLPRGASEEVTLSSNQIILQDGAYYVNISAIAVPISFPSTYQVRLANLTLGTFDYGEVIQTFDTSQGTCNLLVIVVVPTNTTYTLEVQMSSSGTVITGPSMPLTFPETSFCNVKITKLTST